VELSTKYSLKMV